MAARLIEAQPRGSAEFVESSILAAVVPADSLIDLEDELDSWDGGVEDEDSEILPSIPQRQVLLFGKSLLIFHWSRQDLLLMHRCVDELVPVYVVFRTPLIEDVTLKSYLARLAITLEVFAFSTAPQPEPEGKGPPPKELIFSDVIKDSNKPIIVRYEEEEEAGTHIYVAWKVEVFICKSGYYPVSKSI